MNNYITESGKIFWDRAEPFIRMLGEHENESFKKRIHSIEHAYKERIVSFDPDFGKTNTVVDKTQLIKLKIKEKLNEKKKKKILHLSQRNKAKQFKKFLLLKRFEEDDINKSLTEKQKEIREQMTIKYRKIRDVQSEKHNHQSEQEPMEDSKQIETLKDIISGIKEEYFSDLQIEDIADEEVSDISDSEIDVSQIPDEIMN